jgi:hypothetical protein
MRSPKNFYSLREWRRVGVRRGDVMSWEALDFPLNLPDLPNGALKNSTPEEIEWWHRHGYEPANALQHIRWGKTRDEVLADEWGFEQLDRSRPKTVWAYIREAE